MPRRLRDLLMKEVSLVGKPANNRRFLLYKAADGDPALQRANKLMAAQNKGADSRSSTEGNMPQDYLTKDSLIETLKELGLVKPDAQKAGDKQGDGSKPDSDGSPDPGQAKAGAGAPQSSASEPDPASADKAASAGKPAGKPEADDDQAETIKALQAEVANLRTAQDHVGFQEHIRQSHWAFLPGSEEEQITQMAALKKSLPEDVFKSWRDSQDRQAAIVREASIFKEVGSNGAETFGDDTATTKLVKAAQEARTEVTKSGVSDNSNAEYEAVANAYAENSELYRQAMQEQRARANRAMLSGIDPGEFVHGG